MDELESCIDNLGAYAAVRQRLEEIVVAQQKAWEQTQRWTGSSSDCVTLDQYRAIVNQLEDERNEHAKTRAQLIEVQDKLEQALGEVDILRKQIQREKAQFEQTFADLKILKSSKRSALRTPLSGSTSVPGDSEVASVMTLIQQPGNVRSGTSSSRRPAGSGTAGATSSCRPGVKTRSSSQVKSLNGELSEKEIEIQQQKYISRLLDSKSSSHRHGSSVTTRHNCPPPSRTFAAAEDVLSLRTSTLTNSKKHL